MRLKRRPNNAGGRLTHRRCAQQLHHWWRMLGLTRELFLQATNDITVNSTMTMGAGNSIAWGQ
jgi:hypothetical protein